MQKMSSQWDSLQRRAKMLEARLEVLADTHLFFLCRVISSFLSHCLRFQMYCTVDQGPKIFIIGPKNQRQLFMWRRESFDWKQRGTGTRCRNRSRPQRGKRIVYVFMMLSLLLQFLFVYYDTLHVFFVCSALDDKSMSVGWMHQPNAKHQQW